MNELQAKSYEVSGARKLLDLLRSEWDMSITPLGTYKCRQNGINVQNGVDSEWFAIPPKYRKIVGGGLIRTLLTDRLAIETFMYGDPELRVRYKTDKKGKVVDAEVTVTDKNAKNN